MQFIHLSFIVSLLLERFYFLKIYIIWNTFYNQREALKSRTGKEFFFPAPLKFYFTSYCIYLNTPTKQFAMIFLTLINLIR